MYHANLKALAQVLQAIKYIFQDCNGNKFWQKIPSDLMSLSYLFLHMGKTFQAFIDKLQCVFQMVLYVT